MILAAAAGLGSCSAVRHCKAPEVDFPAAIAGGAAADSLAIADMEWWRFYGDSTLCNIIRHTLANNKDMLAAAARVERMRQLYRIGKAGRLLSSGDYYFAAFDLDGNELARSSQPVGSFDAVMMKRPNGYLLDTGYMWELYAPDGTFLEKSLPVGERETLCQLCGDFCTFDVFLPLEENAFLAVGHHGKATEPDEPVVFRITTDF